MSSILAFTPDELTAIRLSLWVALWAMLGSLPVGLAVALLLARGRFWGRSLLNAFVHLPLVIPPVVTGYVLLLLFGRRAPLGRFFAEGFGIVFAFRWTGAALACAVMGFPLLVRSIRLSLDAVDRRLEDAAGTLGANAFWVFATITLPLILPGILAGMILSFARALGEFGATITFVSNIPGETQTLPTAIYTLTQVPGGDLGALRLTLVSVAISLAALFASEVLIERATAALSASDMLSIAVEHRFGGFVLDAAFDSAGGLTALFGRSGAGKTSLINAIAGLLRPDRGRIVVDGAVLTDTEHRIFVPPRRRRVGYVFQEGRLFPHLTVRQNLLYGRWFAPKAPTLPSPASGGGSGWGRSGGDIDQVIDLLGIGGLLARRPANLSGGEKQRVAIGRALLAHPRLLVMDEPLASLDEARKAEILPYIERLRDAAGVPIVYVSHQVAEVARLATTLVVLSEGRVAAVGPAAAIMGRIDLFPLTGRAEAGAILATRVAGHDPAFGLTTLRAAAGELRVPRLDLPVGTALRIRIRARDVMIALAPPKQLSALNVLPGTVVEIGGAEGPIVEMRLDCAGEALVARLTRRSVETLGLAPGRPVYAVIKSIAFDHHAFAGAEPPAPGADAETWHG